MHVDPTAIIVALLGLSGGLVGVYFSRKGQARSEKLEEKRAEVDRITKTYDALQKMLDAAIAQHEHCEDMRVADAQRCQAQIDARDVHIDQLTSALATLQSVVTGEIEAAAAQYDDDDSPEGRERIKEFMRTMRQIGPQLGGS